MCDPKDYPRVLDGLEDMNNLTGLRAELARKVFARTAAYDSAISDYLNKQADTEPDLGEISGFPTEMKLQESKAMTLRYGENPHQQAALYGNFLNHFKQLQGKELSYNNILDISSSAFLIGEFEKPTARSSSIQIHVEPPVRIAWKKLGN